MVDTIKFLKISYLVKKPIEILKKKQIKVVLGLLRDDSASD